MKRKKGRVFNYPVRLQGRYSSELKRIVRRMDKATAAEILEIFTGKKDFARIPGISSRAAVVIKALQTRFNEEFAVFAQMFAPQFARRILQTSRFAVKQSLKNFTENVTIKTDAVTPQMREIFNATVNESVDLIKSIPQQYFDRIKGDVMRTITTPNSSLEQLKESIKSYGNMSAKRANNIALDQTRKAYQGFNAQYLREAGVTKAIWVHTGGTIHPRVKHKKFNGKEFDLTKGAPVGEGGEYVMPAQEPFCRCTFIPVLGF